MRSLVDDNVEADDGMGETRMIKKVSFAELLEWAEKNTNVSPADVALGRMMDIIEEQTGKWPNWDDEAPDWVLEYFGWKN